MHNSSLRKNPTFNTYFSALKDPRRTSKGNYFYPLDEILFLTISSVISGADSWTMVSHFGKTKLGWLRKFYPYEKGIPSHDVLGKLFSRLDHKTFSECFTNWTRSISVHTEGEVVAIDGKTICNSADKAIGKSAIHVVSAYAAENRLTLGQEAVSKKSNEISAIPKLLKILELKGCLVTIDAMGCQKKIADKIIDKGADYLLMVKDNQKELKQQLKKLFERGRPSDTATQTDSGHGRVETRICETIDDLRFLDGKEQWKNLRSIVRVKSERFNKQTGITNREQRYYISSLKVSAETIGKAVRKHWLIENQLHWSLDVIFKEDSSLKKKGNSALNYNLILKQALVMLDREKSKKISKPAKRMTAALDDNYREKILSF